MAVKHSLGFLLAFALALGIGTNAQAQTTASIVDIEIISSPNSGLVNPGCCSGRYYIFDEEIRWAVGFSDVVIVTGIPLLPVFLGGTIDALPVAEYTSGSGTTELVFTHRVREVDMDRVGMQIKANSLNLNGGRIFNVQGDANLEHLSKSWGFDHLVWGRRPRIDARSTEVYGNEILLTYDQDLMVDSMPSPEDFHVLVNGVSVPVVHVILDEKGITLDLGSTVIQPDDTVEVSITPGAMSVLGIFGNTLGPQTEVLLMNAPADGRAATILANGFNFGRGEEEVGLARDPREFTQGFTSGGNGKGYLLDSIDVRLAEVNASAGETLNVHLYEAMSGADPEVLELGRLVCDLTPDATFVAGVNGFNAPAGIVLSAMTHYFVAFTSTADAANDFIVELSNFDNNNEDTLGDGWDVADRTRSFGMLRSNRRSMRIRVQGIAVNSVVEFDESAYYAANEGSVGAVVEVSLGTVSGLDVVVPIVATARGGATAQGETGADWSGVPRSLTFLPGTTVQTFTVMAVADTVDDDGESVLLGFGGRQDIEGAVLGEISTRVAEVFLLNNSPATGKPMIRDVVVQQGQLLTADTNEVSDADGLTDPGYSYQWVRVSSDSTEEAIQMATDITYRVHDADVGKTLKVEVTFADDTGQTYTLASAETAIVTGTAPDANVLVSNVEDLEGGSINGLGVFALGETAQLFATGRNTAGYDLIAVGVYFAGINATASETITFEIFTPVLGDIPPSVFPPVLVGSPTVQQDSTIMQRVYTLVSPKDLVPNSLNFFTAPANATLSANTVYALTLSTTGDDSNDFTFSTRGGVHPVTSTPPSTPPENPRVVSGLPYWDIEAGQRRTQPRLVELSSLQISVRGYAQGSNSPATGRPLIRGTVEAGLALTADVSSGISDDDGLTNASYGYQWIRVDDGVEINIPGAQQSTYQPTAEDQGKTLKVKVSFFDDADFREERISEETLPVPGAARPADCPALAQWCTTVTIGRSRVSPFTDVSGYSITEGRGDVGNRLFDFSGEEHVVSRVDFVDGPTQNEIHFQLNAFLPREAKLNLDGVEFVLDSTVEQTVAGEYLWRVPTDSDWTDGQSVPASLRIDNPETGKPTITGTVQVEQGLVANVDDIADAVDGFANASYAYQWVRVIDGVETDIPGATGQLYRLRGEDQDKFLKVRVAFTDDEGFTFELESAQTEQVAPPPPSKTLVSNIDQLSSFDASVGDVRVPSRYTQRFTTGSNANGYDLLSVSVRVIEAQASAGESVTVYIYKAAPNGALGALLYTLETPSPLDPFSRVNEFLAPSFDATLYPDTEYALAFTGTGDSRHDVRIALTSSGAEDPGSEPDWTIEDEYHFNGQGVSSFGTQYAIMMNVEGRVRADPIPNTPAVGTVTISGGKRAGIRATASVHSVADAVDELGSLAYTYQWVRVVGGVETDIPGATDEVYRLESADVGNRVRVKVFFQDARDNDEELVSAPYPSNQPVRGSANADLESLSVDGVDELYVTKDGSIYVSLSGITSATESVMLRFTLAQADATCEVKYSQDDLQNNAALSQATELLGRAACTGTDEQMVDVALAPGDNHVAVLVRAAAGNQKRFLVALYREEEPDYTLIEYEETRQGVRYSFPEAQAGATVRIVLSGEAVVEDDYVLYRLEDSTAIRLTGPNYTVPVLSGGFVDLAAEAVDDTEYEGDEVFMVTLRWDGPAQPLQGSGVGGRSTSTEYTIVDNDVPVDVSFVMATYSIMEGETVEVEVNLSEAPMRLLRIPLTVSNQNGAMGEDYEINPVNVVFTPQQTSATVTVMAVDDDVDDDDESVELSISTVLPPNVTAVEPLTAVVEIVDNDYPEVDVLFDEASYSAVEGESVEVTVEISADPERTVVVPLTMTEGGGVSASDYSEVPADLTFMAGAALDQTFTVSMVDDEIDDDGEYIELGFGTLPMRMTAVDPLKTVVSIIDDDDRGVTVWPTELEVREGESEDYTIVLESEPTGLVTVSMSLDSLLDVRVSPPSLTFSATNWDSEQIVTVTAVDDEDVENDEMVTVMHAVSGADYGPNGVMAESVMVTVPTGYEEQAEEAWLSRFGSAIAPQVAEAVSKRLEMNLTDEAQWKLGRLASGDTQEIFSGSSFMLPLSEEGARQRWTMWGRGSYTSFDGEEKGLRMDGEVLTGTVGLDYEYGQWLAGLAISHSEGDGDANTVGVANTVDVDYGEMEINLTGVHPYLMMQVDENLSLWGMLGYGQGDLERERGGERVDVGLEMRMGAAGLRGQLGAWQGVHLAVKSEVMAVRLETDSGKNYPEVRADASRMRLLLEGSGRHKLMGGVLVPSAEIGARYDEGDAEEGMGAEVGMGVSYAGGRLLAQGSARGLLAHEESDYDEWGMSGALEFLSGRMGRGMSLRLDSSYGATASGTGELWSRRDMNGVADEQAAYGMRFEAELGYGLNAVYGRGVLTPYAGYRRQGEEIAWRLGSRLVAGESLHLDFEGSLHRRENTVDEPDLRLRITGRW